MPWVSRTLNIVLNAAIVLGVNPHLWLIPVGEPVGDGLFFPRKDEFVKEGQKTRRRSRQRRRGDIIETEELPLLDVEPAV